MPGAAIPTALDGIVTMTRVAELRRDVRDICQSPDLL